MYTTIFKINTYLGYIHTYTQYTHTHTHRRIHTHTNNTHTHTHINKDHMFTISGFFPSVFWFFAFELLSVAEKGTAGRIASSINPRE